jgi:hypothetical protein
VKGCSRDDSHEIVAAVRKKGIPVEYALFPDDEQGFVKKEERDQGIDSLSTCRA